MTNSKTNDFLREWKVGKIICRVLGGPFSNYNGYVGVPKSNPAWGKDYDDLHIDVHGGLTFGDQGKDDSLRWPNKKLWWFGFDTAHLGDSITYGDGSDPEPNGHRWTAEEVAIEVNMMAKQFECLADKKLEERES